MFFNIIKKNFTVSALIIASLCMLQSCLKTQRNIGYSPDAEQISEIKPNITRKAIVRRKLGSPSAISNYGKDTWYYISTEQEFIAFLDPKIKSQKVVAIEFNKDQTVSKIKTLTKEDANEISIASDKTRTFGQNDSILQQLLGNVGRFNTNRADDANR